ncbi:MAG: dTMP kinase [Candidatus Lokiarchaeota archaeon]|nr:dTMP kinase [Candidatus Lokiarchaeota archaeon]
MRYRPLFVVLDGIDGSGTSTHSTLLKGYLESKGLNVHLTSEPSNGEIGKLLRIYLKDKDIPSITDALLFAADRSLHYFGEIKKKLDGGRFVISDRYLESSIVYQSLSSDEITVEWVKEINKHVKKPDITIILDIDPKISLKRKNDQELEKFEEVSFLDKARHLYLSRAREEGHFVINSDDIIELVQEKIQDIVNKKIEESI